MDLISPRFEDGLVAGEPVLPPSVVATDLSNTAAKFVKEAFASVWDIDTALVSEWLAEELPAYRDLTDEDEMDNTLELFMELIELFVRGALGSA